MRHTKPANPDDELVDIYDKDGNITGVLSRIEADDGNYIYPNVIVFIFTSDKKVWIQKRSLTKRHYAGKWDTSACGAVAHGEDPKIAAERELLEEMGLNCELHLVERFLNEFASEDESSTHSRMSYLYVGITNDTPAANEEVEAVAAFHVDELLAEALSRPKEFVPSFDIEYEKALVKYRSLLT